MGLKEMCTKPVMGRIDATNQTNLKAVPSGGKIPYEFLGGILFIGNHSSSEAKAILAEIRKKPDMYCRGQLEVLREPIRGKGEIKAVPAPKSEQVQFKGAIARISKKQVFF